MRKYEGVAPERKYSAEPDPEDESPAASAPLNAIDVLGGIWSGLVVVAWMVSWFWFGELGCTVNGFSGCERSVSGIWLGLGFALVILGAFAAMIGTETNKRSLGWAAWVALTVLWFAVGTLMYGSLDYQPT